MKIPITVMIFTLNEEINLPYCLGSLELSDEVIVIDSFSSDKTEEICKTKGVRFIQHEFGGFGMQRNWAMDNVDIKNDWVLILDADERVPIELANEMYMKINDSLNSVGAFAIK